MILKNFNYELPLKTREHVNFLSVFSHGLDRVNIPEVELSCEE